MRKHISDIMRRKHFACGLSPAQEVVNIDDAHRLNFDILSKSQGVAILPMKNLECEHHRLLLSVSVTSWSSERR